MKKKILDISAIVAFIASILCVVYSRMDNSNSETKAEQKVDTTQVIAMRVSQCSSLYTSEYQLRKILIYDDPASLKGSLFHHNINVSLPLGERRIAIPVTATAKAYIDLSNIGPLNIHRNGRQIEVVLPDPEVTLTSTRIDHKGVRKKVALLRSNFTDEEITKIQQQGRNDIIKSLSSTNILEDARTSAARQIIPIIEQMGFERGNITITFRKDLTRSDIPSLVRQVD